MIEIDESLVALLVLDNGLIPEGSDKHKTARMRSSRSAAQNAGSVLRLRDDCGVVLCG